MLHNFRGMLHLIFVYHLSFSNPLPISLSPYKIQMLENGMGGLGLSCIVLLQPCF